MRDLGGQPLGSAFIFSTLGDYCPFCGEPWSSRRRCGDYDGPYNGGPKPDRTAVSCQECQAPLSSPRFGQRFCSQQCKNRHNARIRRLRSTRPMAILSP